MTPNHRVPKHQRKRRIKTRRWQRIKGHLQLLGEGLKNGCMMLMAAVSMMGSWLGCLINRCRSSREQTAQNAAYRVSAYDPDIQDDTEKATEASGNSAPTVPWASVRVVALLLCVCVFVCSIGKLGIYTFELLASKRTSAQLREAYYQAAEESSATPALPTATPVPATATPAPTTIPTTIATARYVVPATPVPTVTPYAMLQTVTYPENPYLVVQSRFQKIRRQNQDIIGWLTIPGLIDEAVVQRDNSYYLRRDYRGYHNDNGAIFLEESCNLSTRPYTLMLFGHNMKSGAMFGCLRNYENIYFYRNNPFVTFDTMYEDGTYVIFAVGTMSQKENHYSYVDISALYSRSPAWRENVIKQLKRISVINTGIDVAADDQLLLLVTCVDDETERRVLAARRIRADETEAELQTQANKARSK